MRNLSRGSDRLRRPSRPKQHWDFDPAEKKLTPLPVLRYDSGHRKRRVKFTIRRYNHPIRISERIATLDVLSNGRLNWGSGKSSSLTEQMAFQNDLSTLHDEWLEALEIIPRMWREDVFSFQGHFFNIPPTQVIPKPVQQPHPPMFAACSKPDTAAYVGQLGLGALNFAIGSDDYLSEKVREYRLSIAQAKPNGRVPNNSF